MKNEVGGLRDHGLTIVTKRGNQSFNRFLTQFAGDVRPALCDQPGDMARRRIAAAPRRDHRLDTGKDIGVGSAHRDDLRYHYWRLRHIASCQPARALATESAGRGGRTTNLTGKAMADGAADFAIHERADRAPNDVRAQMIADPGFGTVFTDHMAIIDYREGTGWHSARIAPRAPIALDPATSVLHYAQEIFEGLKAYRQADGGISLFRPQANAARFQASAERLAMPSLPQDMFLDSIRELVRIDRDWFPTCAGGSLYIRPFMIASEVFLGVRPSHEYLYMVIISPVGGYFKSGAAAVSIWISEEYTRAAPGGTGAAKCGGNYAASLAAQAEATRHGCDQVVFLDTRENRYVEELGGMNLFFLFDDGRLITPPLSGTILPGITRDSILTLARDEGLEVVEQAYAIDDWRADAASGRLTEAFACGTAAVVTPVGRLCGRDGETQIGSGGPGQTAMRIRKRLVDIQSGAVADPHNWMVPIF